MNEVKSDFTQTRAADCADWHTIGAKLSEEEKLGGQYFLKGRIKEPRENTARAIEQFQKVIEIAKSMAQRYPEKNLSKDIERVRIKIKKAELVLEEINTPPDQLKEKMAQYEREIRACSLDKKSDLPLITKAVSAWLSALLSLPAVDAKEYNEIKEVMDQTYLYVFNKYKKSCLERS